MGDDQQGCMLHRPLDIRRGHGAEELVDVWSSAKGLRKSEPTARFGSGRGVSRRFSAFLGRWSRQLLRMQTASESGGNSHRPHHPPRVQRSIRKTGVTR